MLRLFLLAHLLFFTLEACQGGYNSCIQKVRDSNAVGKNSLSIPVKNNKRIIYSQTPPQAKILKHDPFLGLYLVKDSSKFAYDFNVNMRLQLGRAVVNKKSAIEGKIVKNQVGLNSLASFSEKHTAPALLLSSCCSLEGIVTPRGIIQKEYIQRFLWAKDLSYSDIGIRVTNSTSGVVVTARNPFFANNPFKKGDKIIKLNGKKVNAASVFMKSILFSKVGTKHKVTIRRASKTMTFEVVSMARKGGGELSDTFLEYRGIYFDKELRIIRLSEEFKEYGLLLGDELIQVNGVIIQTQEELLEYLEEFKEFSSLLFQRDKFQFFVKIK